MSKVSNRNYISCISYLVVVVYSLLPRMERELVKLGVEQLTQYD